MGNILTDLAAGGTKGLFSGIGELAKDIRTAITGKDPQKMAEIEMKLMELESTSQQAQAQINLAEAQSTDNFRGRWRPFIGWVCGVGLAIQFLIFPLASMVTTVPRYDFSELINIVVAMLGLGALRTYEKKNGIK